MVLEKKEQFIVNASGKRVGVLLDMLTYERLRDAEEELARVKAEIAKGDFVTLSDYRKARAPSANEIQRHPFPFRAKATRTIFRRR